MSRFFWTLGSLSGATSVMLGAFGAHGLKNRISDPAKLQSWSTAAHYQVCLHMKNYPAIRLRRKGKKKKNRGGREG